MKKQHRALIGVAATIALSLSSITPTQAAPVPVTLADGNCDFSAAEQGHGSLSDPYMINTPTDLREMADCQNRTKSISNAVLNNDGTVTFTVDAAHGTFGVGQVLSITGTDGSAFDTANVKVASATDTSITVKTRVTTAGTTSAAGSIQAVHNYFKLGANIDLGAASTETWNNNGSLSITAAAKASDGTITFTADNTLQAGDVVYIDGMGDTTYNVGRVTVNSATATDFNVNVNYPMADGSASTAGGKAYFAGWVPLNLDRSRLDGNGKTISGMKIYRWETNQGLFGSVNNSTITNLNMVDSLVNQTSPNDQSRDRAGILAGEIYNSIVTNVSITSSEVIAGGRYAGLLAGFVDDASLASINVAGKVSGGAKSASPIGGGNSINWGYYGGVAGDAINLTVNGMTASVEVDGFVVSQANNSDAVATPPITNYFERIGGIFGHSYELEARNFSATGDVTGRYAVGGAFGDMGYDGELLNGTASGNIFGMTTSDWSVESIGGFAGLLLGESDSNNLSASGDVTASVPAGVNAQIRYVGGLAGYARCCGSNNDLESTGTVTVNQQGTGTISSVGGLLGADDCCQIVFNSKSTSDVVITSASSWVEKVGGFVGWWRCCGVEKQNESSGDVTVTITDTTNAWAKQVGGYVGYSDGYGTLNNLKVSGNVTVTNGYQIGGFAGYGGSQVTYRDISVTGNVTNTYSEPQDLSNSVSGRANVGGFIGYQNERASIERVAVANNVTVTGINGASPKNVGGIVGGVNKDTDSVLEILNSYYKGTISGGDYVGGLIGSAENRWTYRIEGNFVAATVTASATDAWIDPVMNGYWQDPSGSNFVDSTLAGTEENFALFNAGTTANLKLAATYTAKGWSFTGNSPWRIDASTNGGYPYLTIPANDDNRTGSSTEKIVEVEKIVEKEVEVRVNGKVVYNLVKSISFSGKSTSLTTAQKKAITLAAKAINRSSDRWFVVTVTPSSANLSVSLTRAGKVQAYLAAELKKLGSKKKATIRVAPATSGASNAVKILRGK